MGGVPSQPLSGENFRNYDQPLTLMIGYVHDRQTLTRYYDEMKRKGYDIVCLEWFWRMLEPQPGKYTFNYLKQTIDMAEKAGLKYMMYIGFWNNNPDWSKRMDGKAFKGCKVGQFDYFDSENRERLIRFYEALAKELKDNKTVMGYVIRLHPDLPDVGKTQASRKAWTEYIKAQGYDTKQKILQLYGNPPAKNVLTSDGNVVFPTQKKYAANPKTIKLWRLALKFVEGEILAVTEDCCKAIRKYDAIKPIRINLAQSYEVESTETPGLSQIGYYKLAEKYRGTINQECFEYPVHAAKEPQLAKHYGIPLTTEGGAVPPSKAVIANLFAHAIENDVAYVAYCHWLVRTEMYEWFKYKPFWKIRKKYDRVYDNLSVASFFKDGWVGPENWGLYFQNHHMFNRLLALSDWEYDMVNEDLLARGKITQGNVLIDTNSLCLLPDTCEEIKKFVTSGGTFVANFLTGYNKLDGAEEYLLLRKYLGVNITKSQVKGTIKWLSKSQPGLRSGFEIKPKPDDLILARWQNNQPAAIVHKLGKGKVIVIGFQMNSADFKNGLFDSIMAKAGVKRNIKTNASEAGLATNDNGDYFVTLLNNHAVGRHINVTIYNIPVGQNYLVKDHINHNEFNTASDSKGELKFSVPIQAKSCNFVELIKANSK